MGGRSWELGAGSVDRFQFFGCDRRVRMKAKIIRLSSSSSPMMFLRSVLLMHPFLLNRNKIFATSKVERRAVLRKFAKSMRETLPDPSAMLLVMLKTAARSCSANLKNRRLSSYPLVEKETD